MTSASSTSMTFRQTIGVIGAGNMRSGLAQATSLAGLSVVMLDVDVQRVTRGREAVANGLDRLVKKAKLAAADRNDPKYRPAPLKETVAAGHVGGKFGRGFYNYEGAN